MLRAGISMPQKKGNHIIKHQIFIIICIISLFFSCLSTEHTAIALDDADTAVYAPGNPYYHRLSCQELGAQRFNISVWSAKMKGLVPCPICILGFSKQQFTKQANTKFRIRQINDSDTVYISPSDISRFHQENCMVLVNGKTGLSYSLAKARNLKPCDQCFPKELIVKSKKPTSEQNSSSYQANADNLTLLAILSAILSNKTNYNNGFLNLSILPNGLSPFIATGAIIIAGDGEYLGEISSQFNRNSIFNEFGTYGSSFSSKSIWNRFGNYGNEFSNLSAFNPLATNPPKIFHNSTFIGYLTNNSLFLNRIKPYSLLKKQL